MKTSGYSEDFIREAVEKGIRAFDERVKRSCLDDSHPSFQLLFPKAGWKKNIKSKEKALKRGNWFKGVAEKESWKSLPQSSGRMNKMRGFQKAGWKSKMKQAAATVVFVPSTRGSTLLKSLR